MITNIIIAIAVVSAAMHGIDSLVNRITAKRRAKQEQIITLCADPREAKHMLSLYAASEDEWQSSPEMRQARRQAKALTPARMR